MAGQVRSSPITSPPACWNLTIRSATVRVSTSQSASTRTRKPVETPLGDRLIENDLRLEPRHNIAWYASPAQLPPQP